MCLVTNFKKPEIATEDIVVYKVLKENYNPFVLHSVMLHSVYYTSPFVDKKMQLNLKKALINHLEKII